MNISYKWLKRYIDFSLSPKELTAVLTSLGLECDHFEEIESIRGGLKGVVIGKVLTCDPHPDSDHLHVTTVDLGEETPAHIVCGAPNVAAGQTVVVATIGTVLYDGDKEIKIKKSKIRGVESFGMICAEDELGLGTSHDGIIVIEEEVKPGTPASEYFNVESDYCLEVELTPNRVDAASHYGVARDLKAYFACENAKSGRQTHETVVTIPAVADFQPDKAEGAVKIEIKDHEGCPRYSGVTIRNVDVKESPEWLRNFLLTIGLRPINNVVDITNFVLHGIGQPLHCFDLSKVAGEKIEVRTCPAGTKFTTLDGVEHTLHEKDLMICDAEKPMCIAGVFGGLDSGVTTATKDIFIESAYFNPTRVRRTARRHGLSTDASFRYERGADPNITVYAAKLAASLVKELAGGEICGDVKDVYPQPFSEAEIDFSLEYCKNLLGKEIPEEIITAILKSLDIAVAKEEKNPDILHLKIPNYRVDVTRPCDVVEEILRVYGYNNVEANNDLHISMSAKTDVDLSNELKEKVADRLTGEGFMEIMNNSLSSAAYYGEEGKYRAANSVTLMNPLSNELSMMRQTLLFGGLESIAYNLNRKADNLRFYEFGNVYAKRGDKASTAENPLGPFREKPGLALWLTGDFITPSWNRKEEKASLFDLKGIVFNVFRVLGLDPNILNQVQGSDDIFEVKLELSLKSGKNIAELGILNRQVLKRFEIDREVIYAEIDWESLFSVVAGHEVTFMALPKTQPVVRDLALLVDKNVQFAQIKETVAKTERKLLRNVSLFDVYEGKNLPAGKKSYGITITLQDDEKTLNDKQIDAVMQKIIDALKKEGAELR